MALLAAVPRRGAFVCHDALMVGVTLASDVADKITGSIELEAGGKDGNDDCAVTFMGVGAGWL
jgi:predicted transcriptional regulator